LDECYRQVLDNGILLYDLEDRREYECVFLTDKILDYDYNGISRIYRLNLTVSFSKISFSTFWYNR
jgi:hypothetical protein